MDPREEGDHDDDGQDEEDNGHEHEHFLAPRLLEQTPSATGACVRRLRSEDLGHGGTALGGHGDAVREPRRLKAGHRVGHVAQGRGEGCPTPHTPDRNAELRSEFASHGGGHTIQGRKRTFSRGDREGDKFGDRRQLLRHARRPSLGGLDQSAIVHEPPGHGTDDKQRGDGTARDGPIAQAEKEACKSTQPRASRAPHESLEPVGVRIALATSTSQARPQVGSVTTHESEERGPQDLTQGIERAALGRGDPWRTQAIREPERTVSEHSSRNEGHGRAEGKPDEGSCGAHARTLGSSGSRPIAVITR